MAPRLHVYDFGLRVRDGAVWSSMTHARLRELFEDAVAAVWAGRASPTGFSTLVLRSQLTMASGGHPAHDREIPAPDPARLLRRTISRTPRSTTGGSLPTWSRALEAPGSIRPGSADDRPAREEAIAERIVDAPDSVTSLDGTASSGPSSGSSAQPLRTNYFSSAAHGRQSLCLAEVGPTEGAGTPGSAAGIRDLGLQPARRGRAPASARSLAAACAGATGATTSAPEVLGLVKAQMNQERRDRADRLQGRLLLPKQLR